MVNQRQVIYYIIADLQLELTLPQWVDVSELLPNFESFKSDYQSDKVISCKVRIVEDDLYFESEGAKLLSDISIVWGDRFTFYEQQDAYWTLIETDKKGGFYWKMKSRKHFSENEIYCGGLADVKNHFISWYIMVAFAQSALAYQCVLVHASVVMDRHSGYAFLGKSGTGKSTHSRLWLSHIEGVTLLNDDNPAVRVLGDTVWIYGTPWSGKTKCYIAEKRPLEALVRLNQAKENKFFQREGKKALVALLPSCSAIRWNLQLYSALINILVEIIDKVKIGELFCLPDREAAQLCYKEIKNCK